MTKNFVRKRFNPRSRSNQERKSRRLAFILGLATLFLIVFLIFWGIPLLINLAGFLGELKEDSEDIALDTIPPIVPDFSVVPEATFSAIIGVRGITEPGADVEVYLNGDLLTVTEADDRGEFFVEKVPLQKGKNILESLAIDKAGNRSSRSEEVSVLFDDIPPELEIFQPEDGVTVYDQELRIEGKTESEEVGLTINGYLVLVEKEGSFSYVYELQEGLNEIDIVAVDLAGNRLEKQIKVTFRP